MKSPEEKFAERVRKLAREIEKHAQGGDSGDEKRLFDAVSRLELAPEARGENNPLYEAATNLRRALRAACETAFHARQAARSAEISALRQEHRAHQPQGYEKELALSRGGAYGHKPRTR